MMGILNLDADSLFNISNFLTTKEVESWLEAASNQVIESDLQNIARTRVLECEDTAQEYYSLCDTIQAETRLKQVSGLKLVYPEFRTQAANDIHEDHGYWLCHITRDFTCRMMRCECSSCERGLEFMKYRKVFTLY